MDSPYSLKQKSEQSWDHAQLQDWGSAKMVLKIIQVWPLNTIALKILVTKFKEVFQEKRLNLFSQLLENAIKGTQTKNIMVLENVSQ